MSQDSSRPSPNSSGDWEAVFNDADPTRVLPPYSSEHGANASSPQATDSSVSAVRYQPELAPSAAEYSAPAAPTEVRSSGPAQRAAYSTVEAPARRKGKLTPYRRVQFIPAFLGALIAHGMLTLLFQLAAPLLVAAGLKSYDTPTLVALDLFNADARSTALPWAIFLGVCYIFAFLAAGYAAARMSVVAPAKQALGVLMMTLLGMLLGSAIAWLASLANVDVQPSFAGHLFMERDFAPGLLTLLSVLALAFFAALLGAFMGTSYHRKLENSWSE